MSIKCPTSFLRLMQVSLIRIGNEIRNWEDKKCANAADKLIKVAETVGTRCVDAYKYDPGEFCVLNHGDCWINNMMFRENEKGEPTDLLLVMNTFLYCVYRKIASEVLH